MNNNSHKISIGRKKFIVAPEVDHSNIANADQASSSVKLREDIHEIVLPNLWFTSRKSGAMYRLEILNNLKVGKIVHINFAHVMGASHPFLDELIAVLVCYFSEEYVLKNVKVLNADEDIVSDLAIAIEIRSNEYFHEISSNTLESIEQQWIDNDNTAYIEVPVDMSKLQDLRELPEPNTKHYELYALNPCDVYSGPEGDAILVAPRHSKMERMVVPAKNMYRYCPLVRDYYHDPDKLLSHHGNPICGSVIGAELVKNPEDELFYWKLKIIKSK